MTALSDEARAMAVGTYRLAARSHRRQALLERIAGRFDREAEHRRAVERLERVAQLEQAEPRP